MDCDGIASSAASSGVRIGFSFRPWMDVPLPSSFIQQEKDD